VSDFLSVSFIEKKKNNFNLITFESSTEAQAECEKMRKEKSN
jgi:predicted CopG family antitoxin